MEYPNKDDYHCVGKRWVLKPRDEKAKEMWNDNYHEILFDEYWCKVGIFENYSGTNRRMIRCILHYN